jgi:hypothetical protein
MEKEESVGRLNFRAYYLKCLFSSKRHFTLCFMEQHCAHTTVLVKIIVRYKMDINAEIKTS